MWNIPEELFTQYLIILINLNSTKSIASLEFNPELIYVYKSYDERRQQLHDEILKAAGTDRNDETFKSWFSTTVENRLKVFNKSI